MRYNIFTFLLHELGVKHTCSFSKRFCEENPYRDSLYGLVKMLDLYKVSSEGIRVKDKNDIGKIHTPFVAQYSNDLVVVSDVNEDSVTYNWYGKDVTVHKDKFMKLWSGVALLVIADEKSIEPDYKSHLYQERKGYLGYLALFFSICALLAYGVISTRNISIPWRMIYTGISIVGGYVSFLLLQKQLHMQNHTADRICNLIKRGNCNNVLESSASKLFEWFSWSEIGFVWFTLNALTVLVCPSSIPTLAFLCVCSLPFTLWSVWYQKFRVRQWCPICLLVQGLLWLQFLSFLINGIYANSRIELHSVISIFSISILVLLAINKVLSLIATSRKATELKYVLRRFKAQKEVFEALLYLQPHYDTAESYLLFGNKEAEHTVTVYGNPYCSPCARMHRRLQPLIHEGFAIRYIFTYFTPELKQTNKEIIIAYRQYGSEQTWQLLSEWYNKAEKRNTSFFMEIDEMNIPNSEIDDEVDRQWKWGHNNGLEGTPTLIVDGYAMPEQYDVEDLVYIY